MERGTEQNVPGDRDSKAAKAKQRSFFACQKRFKHMLIRKGCTVQIVSNKPGYVPMGRNKCLTRHASLEIATWRMTLLH